MILLRMGLKLVKRENASETLLLVLMSAVCSVLMTRLFLEVTDNFQLGSGYWHLAHVLWGGVAMFVGGLLPLLFHGQKIRKTGIIMFGIGTGLFVDEIGKFVTKDHNYFFQPAILIIYGFFVLLFLLYRYMEMINPKDPRTLLYQIMNKLEDLAENDLDIEEKKLIIKRLGLVNKRSSGAVKFFSQKLKELVRKLPAMSYPRPNILLIVYRKIRWFSYYKIFRKKTVLYMLLTLAVADILTGLLNIVELLRWRNNGYSLITFIEQEVLYPRFDSYMVGGKMASDILTSILFLGGLFWLVNKKFRRGLLFFQTGLLVNIFLVSLFNFYFEQFSAVVGLSVNIVILLGLSRLRRDFLV